MEILLIETNENNKELIMNRLKDDFAIEVTSLGEEGLELAKLYDYSLIILGRMLADCDGYLVLRQLRAQEVRSPILFLTGLNNADLKVKALRLGADDCLSTPFNLDEFVERVKILIRHKEGQAGPELQVGKLTLTPKYGFVKVGDKPIKMHGAEYDILEFLCRNKNKPITKDRLLDHLYGHEQDYPNSGIIAVWVSHIRKKLKAANAEVVIKHIFNRGYMIGTSE
jgi:two-component system cell cycle response regulator CtrA